jgi:hypothetical protein
MRCIAVSMYQVKAISTMKDGRLLLTICEVQLLSTSYDGWVVKDDYVAPLRLMMRRAIFVRCEDANKQI